MFLFFVVVVFLFVFKIPAGHLSSDLTLSEENEVYTSLSRKEPVTKLLYVTPEKVRHPLGQQMLPLVMNLCLFVCL